MPQVVAITLVRVEIDTRQDPDCQPSTGGQLPRHTSGAKHSQDAADTPDLIGKPTHRTVRRPVQDYDHTTPAPSEALALEIVAQHTSIPVPRVHRVIHGTEGSWIVMDDIPGRVLSDVWQELPDWKRIWVIFTLRDYVRQLRAIRHPRSAVPGPVAPLGEPARRCESPVFGPVIPSRGPFDSYEALSAFFNKRYRMVIAQEQHIGKAQAAELVRADPFDDTEPLVLTHQDISMQNVVVGDDGRLWLIDWALAGFYPPWFEYVRMRVSSRPSLTNKSDHLRNATISFVCGPYHRQDQWLRRMASALNCVH